MIAQISRTAPPPSDDRPVGRRIPTYIYPDSEDRDRVIVFAIAAHTRTEVLAVDLSVQVRHGRRYYIGSLEKNGDGWQITRVACAAVEGGVIQESIEAAAMSCHEAYQVRNQ